MSLVGWISNRTFGGAQSSSPTISGPCSYSTSEGRRGRHRNLTTSEQKASPCPIFSSPEKICPVPVENFPVAKVRRRYEYTLAGLVDQDQIRIGYKKIIKKMTKS